MKRIIGYRMQQKLFFFSQDPTNIVYNPKCVPSINKLSCSLNDIIIIKIVTHYSKLQPTLYICMNSQCDELNNKYWNDLAFRNKMKKADQNYNKLRQQSYNSRKTYNATVLFSKLESRQDLQIDTYFIYGSSINDNLSVDQLTHYFVTTLPKFTKPFAFVYFNHGDSSHGFTNFKNMLSRMPLHILINLKWLYLVKPSLGMKAKKFFFSSGGTIIEKYIQNKTYFVITIKQLSEKLCVTQKQILSCMIESVRRQFAEQENAIDIPFFYCANNCNSGNTNRVRSEVISYSQPTEVLYKVQKTVSLLDINQYAKNKNGIPTIFQILINYFKEHSEQLNEEGIFRKSANIQEEDQAIEKMNNNQYDFLQKIDNPHLVSSKLYDIQDLIKRFLSKLKTPIIPFTIFELLMKQQTLTPNFLHRQIFQLNNENVTKFETLKLLLIFLNQYVIPRAEQNKMNNKNISICFAPCLMWARKKSFQDLLYITKSIAVLSIMLDNFQEIFDMRRNGDIKQQNVDREEKEIKNKFNTCEKVIKK